MEYVRSLFGWLLGNSRPTETEGDLIHNNEHEANLQASSFLLPPSSSTTSRRSGDIIRIALLLREKVPADIVPLILDHAELWDLAVVASSSRQDRIDEARSGKLQAALLVPQKLPQSAVRRVRFRTISKDQGWSSFPPDQGTYEGSWTWFEAGVRGLTIEGAAAEDHFDLARPINCQHLRNEFTRPEHTRYCVASPSLYKYGSKRIVTNIHAGRDWKTHVVEWDQSHEDADVRKMFNELRGGNRIEVSAHAQFPFWVNEVRLVVIELECAVVRKM